MKRTGFEPAWIKYPMDLQTIALTIQPSLLLKIIKKKKEEEGD
jgi:hypothetical protein